MANKRKLEVIARLAFEGKVDEVTALLAHRPNDSYLQLKALEGFQRGGHTQAFKVLLGTLSKGTLNEILARKVNGLDWVYSEATVAMIGTLLEAGADPHYKPSGEPLIHEETASEVVDLFQRHGYDFNSCDSKGRTVLHRIASRDDMYWTSAGQFIKRGASPHATDAKGRTPLHLVKDMETAATLVLSGAPLDAPDSKEKTALDVALAKGRSNVAKYLASKGADYHLETLLGENGEAATMAAIVADGIHTRKIQPLVDCFINELCFIDDQENQDHQFRVLREALMPSLEDAEAVAFGEYKPIPDFKGKRTARQFLDALYEKLPVAEITKIQELATRLGREPEEVYHELAVPCLLAVGKSFYMDKEAVKELGEDPSGESAVPSLKFIVAKQINLHNGPTKVVSQAVPKGVNDYILVCSVTERKVRDFLQLRSPTQEYRPSLLSTAGEAVLEGERELMKDGLPRELFKLTKTKKWLGILGDCTSTFAMQVRRETTPKVVKAQAIWQGKVTRQEVATEIPWLGALEAMKEEAGWKEVHQTVAGVKEHQGLMRASIVAKEALSQMLVSKEEERTERTLDRSTKERMVNSLITAMPRLLRLNCPQASVSYFKAIEVGLPTVIGKGQSTLDRLIESSFRSASLESKQHESQGVS